MGSWAAGGEGIFGLTRVGVLSDDFVKGREEQEK